MVSTSRTDRYTKGALAAGSNLSDATIAGASGGASRALLAALAAEVVEAASSTGLTRLPEAHLGADLATSSEPHAVELRAAHASFDWLAFSVAGAPMWDEHVGVVHVGHASYDVGVHLADRSPGVDVRIHQLADDLGRASVHSAPSREHQVVVGRLRLPAQHDEAVRLSLDLFQYLSRQAG